MDGIPRPPPRFLADSMVGKLARWLRLLGFDARYERQMDDPRLVDVAVEEGRILLTRDRRLVERRRCRRFVLLASDDPDEQLRQVVRDLELDVDPERVLQRCLDCNVELERAAPEAVRERVPAHVHRTRRRFARCPGCRRVYWRGTHVRNMESRLRDLLIPAAALAVLLLVVLACDAPPETAALAVGAGIEPGSQDPDEMESARAALVELLRREGIESEAVLEAIDTVPRHRFVPQASRHLAYTNQPLPIGEGQTISQPFVVALMTQLLEAGRNERVLEIGTGSGYQAAVLAEMGARVYSVEIVEELADRARTTLDELGYDSVQVRHGDGWLGWPEEAPFDAVIVTAAPEEVPQALVEQLRVGGRMVIPVGPRFGDQQLLLLEKEADGSTRTRRVLPVRFVPMIKGSRTR